MKPHENGLTQVYLQLQMAWSPLIPGFPMSLLSQSWFPKNQIAMKTYLFLSDFLTFEWQLGTCSFKKWSGVWRMLPCLSNGTTIADSFLHRGFRDNLLFALSALKAEEGSTDSLILTAGSLMTSCSTSRRWSPFLFKVISIESELDLWVISLLPSLSNLKMKDFLHYFFIESKLFVWKCLHERIFFILNFRWRDSTLSYYPQGWPISWGRVGIGSATIKRTGTAAFNANPWNVRCSGVFWLILLLKEMFCA